MVAAGVRLVPAMAWVLGLAFAVRLAVALAFPNIVAPDEVFQALEPAHRLVFGQGIVPWEFQVGLRSWLIPLLLAGPMALAHALFANPLAGLVLIRFLLVVAALPIVWVAAQWGARFHGRQGLVVAGVFTALWPDLWLMAPHPLEEVLAADMLVPAIYMVEKCRGEAALRDVGLAAFMLGAAMALRLQVAPAVALAGVMLCGRDVRRWRVGVLAGAAPLLMVGGLDWFTWGQPFRSFWLNIDLNLFRHVAAQEFGAEPAGYFIYIMAIDWLWTLPVLVVLAWRGAKRLAVAGCCVIIILFTHSLIAHKEYRFLFPALTLAVPLAGVGLAGVIGQARQAGRLGVARIFAGGVLLAGPFCGPWLYFMLELHVSSFDLFEDVARLHPRLVSVEALEGDFSSAGGTVLPLDVLFGRKIQMTGKTAFASAAGEVVADAIVLPANAAPGPGRFSRQDCFSGGWIPFAKIQPEEFCVWLGGGDVPAGIAAPAFVFPFPEAAKPFIVRDRLVR